MAGYYIHDSQDDSYINISDGLNMPWIELSEETYGDAYTYPAIYNLNTHQVLQPVDGVTVNDYCVKPHGNHIGINTIIT